MLPVVAVAGDAAAEVDTDNIAVSLLMALPGMTEDVADAILDWLDEDDEMRPYGAESGDYYNTLATPYSAANGPLQSVEELLLVRGVTPTLLFGADVNRNGVIDPDEQQRFGIGIDTPGALGWSAYLTVHGAEGSKRRDGAPRVKVNQTDLELLVRRIARRAWAMKRMPVSSWRIELRANRLRWYPRLTGDQAEQQCSSRHKTEVRGRPNCSNNLI